MTTVTIQESLLGVEHFGKKQLDEFVEKRVGMALDNDQHVDLKAPIHKNKALAFAPLYIVVENVKGKQSSIKMNINILQRLTNAYRAGRQVNLDNILQHGLICQFRYLLPQRMEVCILLTSLCWPTSWPRMYWHHQLLHLIDQSCLIIDGQAPVMALGKKT